jgi:hypothetical protein
MRKWGLILWVFFWLTSAKYTYAVCPVCTVAVGAGVGVSRYLGIDDVVSGLWVGGLVVSMAFWLAAWMEGKNFRLPHKKFWSVVLMVLLTVPPLYWAGMIGIPMNVYMGVDKLLLGTVIGMVLFVFSVVTDQMLRRINDRKVFVPYQKVILPVSYLLVSSFIFYFLTK